MPRPQGACLAAGRHRGAHREEIGSGRGRHRRCADKTAYHTGSRPGAGGAGCGRHRGRLSRWQRTDRRDWDI
ncbi:MAG: hypothetical protein ACE5R6_14160 [Candidatus Heimdallarchaeota archaeon]